ncbi:MAG: hypothetical protein GY913_28955 [Proteobacteria bacterium]|nr:hypothetical protein [Pseudomonadota bacterium]MCP4920943.1 hypothetical protein [Pseudomonadota bacterium]
MTLLIATAWAAPEVLSPADGVWTADHDVTLFVTDDGEPVTFSADTPEGVFVSDPVDGDGVRVHWAIPVTLPEDTETCWQAWTDEADKSTACFFVNSTNDPPTPPTLVLDGSRVVVSPGEDPELRDVWTTVRFDDAESEHAGPDDVSVDVPEYFVLRARTSDGARVSPWVELRVEPEVVIDTGEPIVDTGPDEEPGDQPDLIEPEETGGYAGGGGVKGCSAAPLAAAPWLLGLVLLTRRRTSA